MAKQTATILFRFAHRFVMGTALALFANGVAIAGESSSAVDRAIAASVADYNGTCACPYNVRKDGRKCGAQSAWSKEGGATVLCFPSDVTAGGLAALGN